MKPDLVFGLENASWPALVLSASGLIHRANSTAAATFGGVSEHGGASITSLWAPESPMPVEAFLTALERSTLETAIVSLRTKTGQSVAFQACSSHFGKDGQRYYLVQFLRPQNPSHTVRKGGGPETGASDSVDAPVAKSEISVVESGGALRQRLECALQLTRTVTLEFNNALTSILGHTSLVLSKMEVNDPWRSSLLEIEKSAEKAAEVASDLAAFSRQEKDARSQVAGNLNDLLRRTVDLFQSSRAPAVTWSLQLEPRLYTVVFDEAKLQQAFAKILDNAVQAIGQQGQVVLRTRNQDVNGTVQEGTLRLAQGHYVSVEIEDNGCGIDPSVLPRIFEPFFTTKAPPNHRGLGLAWVYGIITNHGGSVAVSSQLGRSTTVQVYLPAQKKIVRDRTVQTDDLNGTETILMIDDEEMLLTMGEMVLSSFGYRVLTASSGHEALKIFAQNQQQIALVITDLVMPKMGGREVVEHLRKLAPQVRIICSSGYVRAIKADEEEIYLQKPFTSLDLLRKVKQVLGSPNLS